MTTKVKAFAGTLLIAFCLTAQAQESAGVITNVTVTGGSIQFEVVTPAPPGEWTVEATDTLNGPWGPLVGPQPPTSPVLVPVDRPARFFRIQWNGSYSSNIAGYYKLAVPTGFSMIANQWSHGSNTVAEVLPNVPEGTLLYKFDNSRQAYGSINQFRFGFWTQPNETLAPGEGAFIRPVSSFQVLFFGTGPPSAQLPSRWQGFNVMSFPLPQSSPFPTNIANGDAFYFFVNASGAYRIYGAFDAGDPPPPDIGESFWWRNNNRSGPAPTPAPPQGTLYFNNFVPPNIDAPFFGLTGGCRVEGTNWLARLWAGSSPGTLAAIGDPLPFLTGAGAGYLDTRPGAIRYVTNVAPASIAFCEVRFWDARTGATWNQATVRGQSSTFQVTTGGAGSPPSLPADLTGLTSFSGTGTWDICSGPTNQIVVIGSTATFSVVTAGPNGLQYQWQKAINQTNWTNVAGATSQDLTFNPVSASNAGTYRVVVSYLTEQRTSSSGTLTVIVQRPQLTNATLNSSDGSLNFNLDGDPGINYALEISTDLTTWSLWKALTNFSGSTNLTDSAASGQRFYRAKAVAP
jgi:hypothetical protein